MIMRENMGVPTPFQSDQACKKYTRDLLRLEQCVPSVAEVITRHGELTSESEQWEAALLLIQMVHLFHTVTTNSTYAQKNYVATLR